MHLNGQWKNAYGGLAECSPLLDRDCVFKPNLDSNSEVTCSLAGLHNLPNATKFCTKSHVQGPTKHNVLCQGKSTSEVILSHADFRNDLGNSTKLDLDPEISVVRQPETQYVLLIETSSLMDTDLKWKWMNKAAQKFIRYDLPVNSNLAIVTFSDTAKVEHNMVQVHSDQVRARLADTIPDKYHLSKSTEQCVLCAVQKVLTDVVNDHTVVGTHLILLTQGGPR